MSDEFKEQTKILKEILKWIKIGGIKEVKEVLTSTLADDNRKLVYHFSDGRSSKDIEKILGKKVTSMSVTNWWKEWFKLGIVEIHPDYKKRIIKIFGLQDFGISVPMINKVQNEARDQEKSSKMEVLPKETPKIEEHSLKQNIPQEGDNEISEEE